MKRSVIVLLVLGLAVAQGCSDDRSTKPSPDESRFLAGGGRQADDGPFAGGPGGSGPGRPDFDPPSPGYMPLFYSDVDCQQNPSQGVITNQEDWQTWWTGAIDCLDRGDDPPPRIHPLDEGVPGDSGIVGPDSLFNPYPPDAPEVDFTTNVILTISLPRDSLWGSSVWIEEVTGSPSRTTVRYTVSHLGDDCMGEIMMPVLVASSPTIAVMVPRPVTEPVTWQRNEIVYNCSWEPDPNEPLTLYYTDADCELGPAEAVINDRATFDSWLEAAFACDQARWYDPDTQTSPGNDSLSTSPPMPPTWFGMGVDFTTHAIIVLRGDSQGRWGGGIWLEGLRVTSSGTTIDYTVMMPSDSCPAIEKGGTVRPTAAIRVPLPLSALITWNRHTETIDCDWQTAPGDSIRP
jgi:hypothetical protein